MDCDAELARHGALDLGAEVVTFLAGVCERGVRRGQGLGALICGADLGAMICGAELPFITRALFPAEPYSFFSTSCCSSPPTSPHFDS
jgi:hypothetical protein